MSFRKRRMKYGSVAFTLGIATGSAWLGADSFVAAQQPTAPMKQDPAPTWSRSASPLGSSPQQTPTVIPASATQPKEPVPATSLPGSPIAPTQPPKPTSLTLPLPTKLPAEPPELVPVFRAVRKETAPEPHAPPEKSIPVEATPTPWTGTPAITLPVAPELTPPAQPAKLVESSQAIPPIAPDFQLRTGNDGNNVKTGSNIPTKPQAPDMPVVLKSQTPDMPVVIKPQTPDIPVKPHAPDVAVPAWVPVPQKKQNTEAAPTKLPAGEPEQTVPSVDRNKLLPVASLTSEKYIFPLRLGRNLPSGPD